MSKKHDWSRREVLKLAAASAVASATVHSAYPATPFSMPGLYPGRVVGVEHSGSSSANAYQTPAIQNMIRSGMMALTGSSNYITAWRKLFQPGDVVGIKINPNGLPQIISSQACLMEVIQDLLLAGVLPTNIVVFERYGELLGRIAGWLPAWVRTAYATPGGYLDDQTGIAGYDPNYYVDLPQILLPSQNPNNPAHTRSYAALFLTRQVTKVISLAVLKDHPAAGVTLSLKNLAIGCANNANRAHDGPANRLIDFIPAVVSMPVIRNKTTLAIIDGVHGLYAQGAYGGDGTTIWEHKTMYFATDLVAADRMGWLAIDAQRVNRGLLPEQIAGTDRYGGFPERQPQHIEIAGQMGLGEWRDSYIDYRKIVLA